MSVLIRDMEMPKDCLECELYGAMYSSGCNVASLGIPKRYNYDPHIRPDWCPLVELPKKHGRLVEFIDVATETDEDTGLEEVNVGEVFEAYLRMKEAPAVIEAEGEG